MYQDNITLCGASAYEKKFYFNQDFNALPDHVKKELQIMCVLYTEDVGGILTLEFDENGRLQFKTEALEADARYDEIGSGLKIKQLHTLSGNGPTDRFLWFVSDRKPGAPIRFGYT